MFPCYSLLNIKMIWIYCLLLINPYCLCVERTTLFNCLIFFSSCFSASLIQIIGESGAKTILQTIEQPTQYTVLEIQFRSLKYTVVIRTWKNVSQLPPLSRRCKVIKVYWYKQPTLHSFQTCIYLLKLYDKSVIYCRQII